MFDFLTNKSYLNKGYTILQLLLYIPSLKLKFTAYHKYKRNTRSQGIGPVILKDLLHTMNRRHINGMGVNPILLQTWSLKFEKAFVKNEKVISKLKAGKLKTTLKLISSYFFAIISKIKCGLQSKTNFEE